MSEWTPREEMDADEREDFDEFREALLECMEGGVCLPCFDAGVDHRVRCVVRPDPLHPYGKPPRLPSEVES